MTQIVGICGNLGSGKDTSAGILKLYGYKHLAFAWHIKKFLQDVFGFTTEQLWGPSEFRNAPDPDSVGNEYYWENVDYKFKLFVDGFVNSIFTGESLESKRLYTVSLFEWFYKCQVAFPNPSPRLLLQTLGTEWGRSIDPDIWAKATLREAQKYEKVVISDVRFLNEVDLINEANGKVAKITRYTDDLALETGNKSHTSETEQLTIPVEKFHCVIENNGSILDLHTYLAWDLELYLPKEIKENYEG